MKELKGLIDKSSILVNTPLPVTDSTVNKLTKKSKDIEKHEWYYQSAWLNWHL